MKKSTIVILSAIFIIMILFIPNNTKALNNSTLIVDYENENFQNLYNTYIDGKLDTILTTCRNRFGVEEVMVAYTKSPFRPYPDAFICYDISRTETISAYVESFSTLSYLVTKWSNSRSFYINALDYTYLSDISSSYGNQSMQAFSSPANTSPNSNNEFFTNFLPTSSLYQIPFYSDKDIIVFNNDNNQNSGLFINGTYVQYGENITLFSNFEEGFLPKDYQYINLNYDDSKNINSLDLSLQFPIISEEVPYSFQYNAYFILDGAEDEPEPPDVKYYLDGSLITINNEIAQQNLNTYFLSYNYVPFSNATYYFEIYQGNSLESKDLLQQVSFKVGEVGNSFTGDAYIDYIDKDNTSNVLGGTLFSSFTVPDFGLTSIVTAPLRLYNNFLNDTCTPPVINILGADFRLPCADIFWGRDDIQEFKEIYQLIVFGLICYRLGIGLIKDIDNLKDPDNSKINTIDL